MNTIEGGITTAFDLVDEEVKKTLKIFPAVYEDQKDNVFDGGVTCAITSLSMLLQSYNLPDYGGKIQCGPHEEDKILKDIRANLSQYQSAGSKLGIGSSLSPASEQSLRTNFIFLKWYANYKYGVTLNYAACKKASLNRIVDNIEAPFVMSTSNALTGSGHIILARGRIVTASGLSLIANDPYGVYPYRAIKSGEEVVYDMKMFPTADSSGEKTYHMLSMGDYPK